MCSETGGPAQIGGRGIAENKRDEHTGKRLREREEGEGGKIEIDGVKCRVRGRGWKK